MDEQIQNLECRISHLDILGADSILPYAIKKHWLQFLRTQPKDRLVFIKQEVTNKLVPVHVGMAIRSGQTTLGSAPKRAFNSFGALLLGHLGAQALHLYQASQMSYDINILFDSELAGGPNKQGVGISGEGAGSLG